jgi:putative FmdB family regulatory protein
MPIFEFSCDQCTHQFEELVLHEPADVHCPKCGSKETHKLLSRCRSKISGNGSLGTVPSASGGGCAGCSGGSCSSCH